MSSTTTSSSIDNDATTNDPSTTIEKIIKNPKTKCIKCGVYAIKTPGTKRCINSDAEIEALSEFFKITVIKNSFMCVKCYSIYSFAASKKKKITQVQSSPNSQILETQESPNSSMVCSQSSSSSDPTIEYKIISPPNKEYVELPFPRPISTHEFCFLCRRRSGLINVPFEGRKQVFIKTRIFIPQGNRCCPSHLLRKRFYEDEITNIKLVSSVSKVNVDEVTKLLDNLSTSCHRELNDQIGDYTLSEERLFTFTGLTWEQIIELREMMTSVRNTLNRNITQALVVFLFRLRTGNSNKVISSILGLERPQQVSEFSESILKAFEKDILPTRFGIKAVTRELLIENTAPIVKKLHGVKDNELALVVDGTYLRCQKSSNNDYQRKSYSGQKKVPICKPFTICTTNGYIVDIMGPYYANQNDAAIMKEIIRDPDGLVMLLKEGDYFFVDRGFRDVQEYLEENNYKVLIPALKGKRRQLTAVESNSSRLVTLVRWVVEADHGIISTKYQLLHQQFDNKMIPVAALYCKIAGFLVNQFGKRCVSRASTNEEILAQISRQNNMENTLATEAEARRWSRRKTAFQRLTSADILDFPELTEEDLIIFFTGTYQYQRAVSYLAELLNDDNEIEMQFLKEAPEIIKVQVKSRHISRKTYNCYVDYEPNSCGYRGIRRYCCDCANGLRTIGCCSHLATVIYFLSHARYQSRILRPSEKLTNIFQNEGITPVINEDSDED